MADDVYTTLLNFVTDAPETSRKVDVLTGSIKKMEEQTNKAAKANAALDKNVSFPGDELSKDFELFQKGFEKTFSRVKDKLVDLRTGTQAASADLRKFAGTSQEELSRISSKGVPGFDIEKIKTDAKRTGLEISKELREGILSGKLTDSDKAELAAIEESVKGIGQLEKARAKELQEAIRASNIKSSLLTREASLLQKQATEIQRNAQLLRNQAQQLQGISQLALGAGAGVVGGIFAFASKYVRDAKEANAITIAWKASQDSLAKSGERIGKVFAQEALPLLKLAADTAQKAAGFIEKHPELVQAALNVGVVVAALGAVGLAVSKGIKLYADQLYLSSIPLQLEAGRLQFAAAQEQLIAARLRSGVDAGDLVGGGAQVTRPGLGGGVMGTVARLTLIATAVYLGAEFGLALGNKIGEKITGGKTGLAGEGKYGLGDAALGIIMSFQTPAYLTVKALNALHLVSDDNVKGFRVLVTEADKFTAELLGATKILKVLNSLGNKNTTGEVGAIGSRQGESDSTRFASREIREQASKAYQDYKSDDLKLVQDHYAERGKVIRDSLKAEANENAQYSASASRIQTQGGRSIAQATGAYERQAQQAEEDLALRRAEIVRDGGIEIQRIEEQLQESLRKLRMDHEDRLADLVDSRDALGIVKEQRKYNQERAEQIRSTNIEVRQRRSDLALKLQDLQTHAQQERDQRFEDFQARIAEIRSNTAAQLVELAERHRAEIAQIRQARVEKLKEMDDQLKTERKRRYEYFLDQIRQLDAGLLGESKLRKQRQEEMLKDLDTFLTQYRTRSRGAFNTTTTTGRTPAFATGGYASYGMHMLGDRIGGGRGKPEYILRGDVTEMAERVLGGRLSQERVLSMLNSFGNRNRNNVTYNDQRRVDSRVSNTDRERLANDTRDVLEGIVE